MKNANRMKMKMKTRSITCPGGLVRFLLALSRPRQARMTVLCRCK